MSAVIYFLLVLLSVGNIAGDTLPTLSLASLDSSYASYFTSSSESSSSSSSSQNGISSNASVSFVSSSSSSSKSFPSFVSPMQLAVKINSKQQQQQQQQPQQRQQRQQQQRQQRLRSSPDAEYVYDKGDYDYDLYDGDYDDGEDGDAENDTLSLEHLQPRGPYFASTNTSTSVYLGSTATLECTVLDLTNESVSWLRLVDDRLELLTWGSHTYTIDSRYSLVQEIGDKWQRWQLVIRNAIVEDQGQYRCQVATQPPMIMALTLNITEPVARVVDERGTDVVDKHYNSGSMIELKCIIEKVPFPHGPVTWRRGSVPLTFNTSRGGISVKGSKDSGYIRSRLYVANASPSDSGLYSCWYSNYTSDNVTVHVIAGENSQAMQHDALPETPTSCGSFISSSISSSCIAFLLLFYSTSGFPLIAVFSNAVLGHFQSCLKLSTSLSLVFRGLLVTEGYWKCIGRVFETCLESSLGSASAFDSSSTRQFESCFESSEEFQMGTVQRRVVRSSKDSNTR